MPQGKSDSGLLILGGAIALFLILRSRQTGVEGGQADIGFPPPPPAGQADLMIGPPPSPMIGPSLPTLAPQPKPQQITIGGVPVSGITGEAPIQIPGIRTIAGALPKLGLPGATAGGIIKPQQPKPEFITVSEFQRRYPTGIVQRKTGAEQFGEAVNTFFGGLFKR